MPLRRKRLLLQLALSADKTTCVQHNEVYENQQSYSKIWSQNEGIGQHTYIPLEIHKELFERENKDCAMEGN